MLNVLNESMPIILPRKAGETRRTYVQSKTGEGLVDVEGHDKRISPVFTKTVAPDSPWQGAKDVATPLFVQSIGERLPYGLQALNFSKSKKPKNVKLTA